MESDSYVMSFGGMSAFTEANMVTRDVIWPFVTSVVFLDLPLLPIENKDETNRAAEESSYWIKRVDDKRFRRC